MGTLSLQEKVCIFIPWVLMLTLHGAAEREYFHLSQKLNWDQARNHCQVCFKELVTVTPVDVKAISQNLTSDFWIGLRKNLSSSSHFTNMSWTQWANGDPITFQNWYPGWPVLKSSLLKRDCCSCSCTCPTEMTPAVTRYTTTTHTTQEMTSTSGLTPDGTSASGLTPDGTSASGRTPDGTSASGLTPDGTSASGLTPDGTSTSGLTPGMRRASGLTPDGTSASGLTPDGSSTSGLTPDGTSASGVTVDATEDVTDMRGSTNTTQTMSPVNSSSSGVRNVTTQSTPVFTAATNMAQCVRSPMVPPRVPEAHENYMIDSCVAMLSFGAWIEKNCSDLLPFICYEDRFIGKVTVIHLSNESAQITWLPAPGPISHYNLVVKSDPQLTHTINGSLTYNLTNLTAGSRYSVQVFPVKCNRTLNPQNKTFYTIPNKVTNLTVTKQTETSIFLSWNKPVGSLDFYHIKYDGVEVNCSKYCKEVSGLIPGTPYTFTVFAGVKSGKPTLSEGSEITAYTRPGVVSQLRVSDNTNSSLLLTWQPPEGNLTDFWVKATNVNNDTLYNETVPLNTTSTRQEVRVPDLPMGTEIILSVTALANYTWGDNVTIKNYTVPGPIFNLMLVPSFDSIVANWTPPDGSYTSFTIELWLNDTKIEETDNHVETEKTFEKLKTGARYTVKVYSVSGNLFSPPEERSRYTIPRPPTDAKATANETHLTLQWKAPANVLTINYTVSLVSEFWGYSEKYHLVNKTSHTFSNLKSGTRYELQVWTTAEQLRSNPAEVSHCTVADKREISLSMLCSSSETLLCASNNMTEEIFDKLKDYFNETLGNNIFWELDKQGNENPAV